MKENTIICGDSLELLREMLPDSIDTIITDPPYGLSFMGKHWDYDVPSIEIWQACLRVLKPGGTLLCFAGSRTQHRMAVNVEDAGFVLKDCILWLYAQGFPKATDISKQLDKQDAVQEQQARRLKFTEWVRAQGVTSAQIDDATNTNMGGHYTTQASQPAVMTREHLELCRGLFSEIPEWVVIECDKRSVESKNFADREVVGEKMTKDFGHHKGSMMSKETTDNNETQTKTVAITAPATPEAKLWNGWKSHSLKPAYEPVLVCMKPNDGSYAENALKWGVSGLWIDGGRIGTEIRTCEYNIGRNMKPQNGWNNHNLKSITKTTTGRFPANIILDEEAGRMLDEQSGVSKSTGGPANTEPTNADSAIYGFAKYPKMHKSGAHHSDSGGASRFFYCAKASKAERNAGCEGLEEKQTTGGGGTNNTPDDVCGKYGSIKAKGHNHHPTVKPLALMEYLCKLTKTPTGGIVLDPFCGSGTTCKACVNTGRKYIGIERDPEYCKIAEARIKEITKGKLF